MVLEGVKRKRIEEELLEILACPVCKDELEYRIGKDKFTDYLFCSRCEQEFIVTDGIPELLPPYLGILSIRNESQASLSIKQANMDYGYVYHKENTATAEAIDISSSCLVPRSEEFILSQLNGHYSRILETCCATGTTASYLVNNGYRPFCFDISNESINSLLECHPGINNLFIADAENIPILDNSFDTVIFNGALHHLPNPRRALLETFRILKSGGQVVIVEPNNERSEIARIVLKALVHPKSALKDLKRNWCKVKIRISGKEIFEYDGKKYQKDDEGRWIKYGEMDQEISLSYTRHIAKSVGFKVRHIETHDIAIIPFRLFNCNPGIKVWNRLQGIDSILKKIPFLNKSGEMFHMLLQKP